MNGFQIVAFGLATGSGMAWIYVATQNWRVLLSRLRRPGEPRRSLVFLAGPVLIILLAQSLAFTGASLSPRQLSWVVVAGLALDPGALPALAFALARRLRNRSR